MWELVRSASTVYGRLLGRLFGRMGGLVLPVFVLSVFVLSVSFLTACSSVSERACTLIGCDDGINISISGAPDASWTLEIEEPDGTVHRRECAEDGVCTERFFPGVTSEAVTVRVITTEGTREWEMTPDYERLQPNGPGCPPVCHQARLELSL